MTLEQIGKEYGISKQTVSQRFARIEVIRPARPPKCARIDKLTLENLYTEKRLSIDKISREFDTYPGMINQALEFYSIPKRISIKLDGKNKDILKRLAIGEKTEIKCSTKLPHANLHVSANRIGIKISMKKIRKGIFTVTRIA